MQGDNLLSMLRCLTKTLLNAIAQLKTIINSLQMVKAFSLYLNIVKVMIFLHICAKTMEELRKKKQS